MCEFLKNQKEQRRKGKVTVMGHREYCHISLQDKKQGHLPGRTCCTTVRFISVFVNYICKAEIQQAGRNC